MKWGVPACQRASSFHKYTRARAHVYILENCWHAGTLVRWHTSDFLFPLHALLYAYPKQYLLGLVWTCLRPAGDPR